MTLSSICIKRPVFTIVLSLLILIFGAIGFYYLGVREYPVTDSPVITVSTNYTGANPDIIESQVTEPLEQALNSISGVRSINSTSSQGQSRITIEFTLETDMETAANDVRDMVSRTMRRLPADITAPSISKSDANADAIIMLTVENDDKSGLEINKYTENVIKERLQTIPEVSSVAINGEKKYAIRIILDPVKLAGYGLTALDVKSSIEKENIELPAGKIMGQNIELTIRTAGSLSSAEEFNNLLIRTDNGKEIRLADIGYAVLGAENEQESFKQSGSETIALAVTPQPGANYISIADELYKRLAKIKKELPPGYRVNVVYDKTGYIKNSIKEVEETFLIAFLLVVLVIFVFLRNFRSTLIPAVVIPISLIGSFFVMYLLGFSINLLTLLAIVMATSLVCDDAIVVLENIYSKIEDGMEPMQAGHKGSQEIFFAVISTTLTLSAVFLPVIFLQGFTGRLFREFGIVVAVSVMISSFVSLTLTPMMSAHLLKKHTHDGKLFDLSEKFFNNLAHLYRVTLESFMRHKSISVIITIVALGVIFGLGGLIPSEIAPLEDRSSLRLSVSAQEGVTYDYMTSFGDNLTKFINDSLPEKEILITRLGETNFWGRIGLIEPSKRKRSQQDIADYLNRKLKNFPEAKASVMQEPTISGGGRMGQPMQAIIQTSDFNKLRTIIPQFLEAAERSQVLTNADFNLKFNKPELNIEIDREKAKALGVSVADIAQILQTSFSEQRFGYFMMEQKQYQIIGQLQKESSAKPLDLQSVYVKNKSGVLLQLDNFIKVSEQSSPVQIYHYNRAKSATLQAGIAKGYTMSQAIKEVDRIAKEVLDENTTIAYSGSARDFLESSSNLNYAFLLALLLIYLILAAQFESFRDPFTIMLTVPLAIAGAFFSLWYFNQTMNIFSQIGIIMLIGLVTKNGILIVEFANQRLKVSRNRVDAVVGAAEARFRPIMMTSITTVLGALPVALAIGAGSESRVSMGIVIIGGLSFSLVMSLFVVPAVYVLIGKKVKG